MTSLQQKIITKWVMYVLGIHGLILFGLSYGLSAQPQQAIEWAMYHVITDELNIITQRNFSPYPFVSVVTSVYAVFSGTVSFILFLFILKHLGGRKSLSYLLQVRFADQIKIEDDLNLKYLFKSLGLWLFGGLMVVFHLFFLNDNDYGSRGGLYPAAFNSRFGIFVVQAFFSIWVMGIWLLFVLWLVQIKQYWQQRSKF